MIIFIVVGRRACVNSMIISWSLLARGGGGDGPCARRRPPRPARQLSVLAADGRRAMELRDGGGQQLTSYGRNALVENDDLPEEDDRERKTDLNFIVFFSTVFGPR